MTIGRGMMMHRLSPCIPGREAYSSWASVGLRRRKRSDHNSAGQDEENIIRIKLVVGVICALVVVSSLSAQDNKDAEKLFHEMEAKLDKAKTLDLSFAMTVEEGALPGLGKGDGIKGTLAIMSGNKLRLEYSGARNAEGKPTKVVRISDGTLSIMTVEGEGKPTPSKVSKDLATGFLTVVARPGIFMSQLPLADIKVADEKERFAVSGFRLGTKEKVGGRETQRVDYQLATKGDLAMWSITLWIDLKTGLLVKRLIASEAVPNEKVVWSETYDITLDAKLDPKLFELPK